MGYWVQLFDQKINDMFSRGYGRSRNADKKEGTSSLKIYSSSTRNTYRQQLTLFGIWLEANYPSERRWKIACKLSKEYLIQMEKSITKFGKKYAACSLTTSAAAINKVFQIKPGDKYRYTPPRRERKDFIRSRISTKTDRYFSVKNNQEIIDFARGVGCRKNILAQLEGRDLYTAHRVHEEIERLNNQMKKNKDDLALLRALEEASLYWPSEDYLILHRKDKGGRWRLSPILPEYKQVVVNRMISTPMKEKVWGDRVPVHMDVHALRAEYANRLYRLLARDLATLTKKEKYIARKDRAGLVLDKAAMSRVAVALGHGSGRTVFAEYYLREEENYGIN